MTDDSNPDPITPEDLYKSRRLFLKTSIWATTTILTSAVYKQFSKPKPITVEQKSIDLAAPTPDSKVTQNLESKLIPSSLQQITNYNNFYEFSTDKAEVAERARGFITTPWQIEVTGLVHKPSTFDLGDLLKFQQFERIYRFRCVEGWSMVIPWVGFELSTLLKRVDPMGSAKFVAFESYYDPKQMPNADSAGIPFPYVEGLRIDEAMHPLTLLATGLYGKTLPNQNGAPIRLVVPWKYGFKSAKSIVRIRLQEEQPITTWNQANAREYGFYSNVNPSVDHPRWSQSRERRIGESSTRPTLFMNGYADRVASLYTGMNLTENF